SAETVYKNRQLGRRPLRQLEEERGPCGTAVIADAPLELLDDRLRDAETQPRSLALRVRGAGLRELLEQLRPELVGDAGAAVDDAHADDPSGPALDGDRDLGASGR